MENDTKNSDARYLLSALIEIYSGRKVYLAEFDVEMERGLLRDLFSTAISFARSDDSRKTLSEEIYKSVMEGVTARGQIDLAEKQSPDLLNAKMLAAAHLLKVMDDSKIKLS